MDVLRGRRAWSIGLFAGAGLVLAAGYLFLISPAKGEAGDVAAGSDAISAQIAQIEELAATQGADQPALDYANLLRLAKAVPDEQRDRDVIVELDAAAERTGAEFASVSPVGSEPAGALQKHGYSTTFSGTYDQLVALMAELRGQTTVRGGRLTTSGRLFTIDALDLHEGEEGFPVLEGSLELSAYAFGADPGAVGGAEATDDPAATETGDETAASPEEGD